MLRGGYWIDIDENLRIAWRFGHSLPDFFWYSFGFRCARSQ